MKLINIIFFIIILLGVLSCKGGNDGSLAPLAYDTNNSNTGTDNNAGGNVSFNNSQIEFEGVSTASLQSASQVKLFFNSARGGSGFTVYRVYLNNNFNDVYQTFPFGSYSVDPSTGKTFVQVTNLTSETNYSFSIRAMDALQGIEDKNTASASITTPHAPPTFNGLESISDVTTTSMKLFWTAAANASRYDIYKVVSGSMVYFSTVPSTSTSFNATSLNHSTLYTWRVRVIDINNSADANTSDISQTTASPISFAGAQSISNVSSSLMQINWTHVAGSLTYRIYNSSNLNSPILTVPAPQNYATITGLTPGGSYSLIVRSVDGFGAEDTNTVIQSATTISIEAIHNGWTNIYAVGPRENFQSQVLEREDIRLSWKPFTVSEGLVLGYNVYLSDNLNTGFHKLNTNLIAPSGADNESFNVSVNDTNPATDLEPLEPGKLYYFRVTIVVNGYEITSNPTSPVDHTIVRVLYPPKNTALVHRWIVNQQICNDYGRGLGTLNGVNVANHYRCPFNGLGHTDVGGQKFYDYGKDMVVDVNELGCNFSRNSCTSHSVGATADVTDCVGNSAPDTNMKAAQFSVYYFRDGGHGTNHTCLIQRSADSNNPQWVRVNALDNDNEIGFSGQNLGSYLAANKVNLPPLNWITQANAYHTCQTQTETLNLLDNQATFRKRPLRRKEYMGASLWSPNMTPQIISNTSLQHASILNPCAYGPSAARPGSENLDYSHTYWPNRQWAVFGAAWIDESRSYNAVRGTGAETTKNCRSRFGVQDMVGNISEWLIDHIQCGIGTTRCDMETTTALYDTNFKNDWKNSQDHYYNIAINNSDYGGSYTDMANWTYANFLNNWGGIGGASFSRINTPMGVVTNCRNGICEETDDLHLSQLSSGGIINNFMSPVGIFEKNIFHTYPAQNNIYHGFLSGGATGYSYWTGRTIGRYMTDIRPSEQLTNTYNEHGFSLGTRCGFPLSY